MRLYYFTSARYGLEGIRDQRLKVSTVADLNDPFEWLGVTGSKAVRRSIRHLRDSTATELGFICFSRDWRHPMLWGHYADNHKGLCLGFDVEDSFDLMKVQYIAERKHWTQLREKPLNEILEIVTNLLNTKFDAWEYEAEQRLFVPLGAPDPVSGLHFHRFGECLRLRQVIVGERSNVTREQLNRVLADSFGSVEKFKVRAGFKRFEMVRNQLKRAWK